MGWFDFLDRRRSPRPPLHQPELVTPASLLQRTPLPEGLAEALQEASRSMGFVVLVGHYSPHLPEPIRLWRRIQGYPPTEIDSLVRLIGKDLGIIRDSVPRFSTPGKGQNNHTPPPTGDKIR